MKRFLICGALLCLAACSSKPDETPYVEMTQATRVPRFERDDVQEVRYRFYGEREQMLTRGKSFFPNADGAKSCDLGGEAYETLLFGGTKAGWASSGSAISNAKISVLDGECRGPTLSGPASVLVTYGFADSRNEGETQTRWLIGEFDATGMTSGIQYHLSNDSFAPGEWRAHYDTRPDFSLSFRFTRSELYAYLYEREGLKGVSTAYQGDQLMSVSSQLAGMDHGITAKYVGGDLAEQTCFVLGAEAELSRCEGESIVLSSEEEAQLAAAVTKAEQPRVALTSSGAIGGDSGPWPELPPLMKATGGGEKDTAIVVGVEDYAFVSDVPGAATNARDWYRYFTQVRGLPAGNVKLVLDASATDDGIRAAVKDIAAKANGGTLWFVFIGHGAPAQNQRDGLLVGVDAQQTARGLYGRSVSASEIVSLAAAGGQSKTVMVVDACFSGRSSDGALAPGLQPMLSVDFKLPSSETLFFSAGKSDQFAGPLPKAQRPAFSYLMLGALLGWGDANRDGVVDSSELVGYAGDTLSAVLTDRAQTPELTPVRTDAVAKSAGASPPDVSAIVLQR